MLIPLASSQLLLPSSSPTFAGMTLTGNPTISNTAPGIVFTDTTASAKGLTIGVDANLAQLRESAGASGSLLVLDLANNYVGVGTASPGKAIDVVGDIRASANVWIGTGSNIYDGGGNIAFSAGATTKALWGGSSDARIYTSGGDTIAVFDANKNIGIGTSSMGASMIGGMSVTNGTAPSGNVADCFQHYAFDQAAGNSAPHWRTENGSVVKLYLATTLTQTYATADATHANFTSANLATTAATQTVPWGFASQAQAENIATQHNLLMADMADLKQFVNSVADLLQLLGVAG